jgi:hypothetical protein
LRFVQAGKEKDRGRDLVWNSPTTPPALPAPLSPNSSVEQIKARLLAIPSRVTRLLVGKVDANEIREILNQELFAVLDELSAYDPAAFSEQNEEYMAHLFPASDRLAKGTNGNGDPSDE